MSTMICHTRGWSCLMQQGRQRRQRLEASTAAAAGPPRPLPAARSRQQLVTQAVFSPTTNNPAFTSSSVNNAIIETQYGSRSEKPMTVDGTINKASLLLVLSMASAAATWMQVFSGNAAAIMATLSAAKMAGMVGIGAALASMFKPQWSPVTAPVYAIAKGCAMAGLSAVLEMQYPGIAMNAVILTFSTAASCFFAVRTRLIQITDKFADTVRAVTGGYFVAMLLIFLGGMVGLKLPGLLTGGPIALGVGLVSSGLAAANLLMDFDFIEKASYQRLPGWMEWYSAQSVMLTLVWMWTEILRVLMVLAGMGRDSD